MKALLDADVLLDVALDREKFVTRSNRVVQWCQETPGAAVIAWHSVSNIYYVLRAARSDLTARKFISDLLRFCDIASGDAAAVRHALTLSIKDFEDALQVAAAISGNVQWIITRNIPDYRGSPLPAITPHDFIRRFLPR